MLTQFLFSVLVSDPAPLLGSLIGSSYSGGFSHLFDGCTTLVALILCLLQLISIKHLWLGPWTLVGPKMKIIIPYFLYDNEGPLPKSNQFGN